MWRILCVGLTTFSYALMTWHSAAGDVSAAGVDTATIRFLVGESGAPSHNDSYVLPLSDPTAIAHARELIEVGPSAGAAIVSARIAAGANGINRDYRASGSPAWSWHVTEFLGFADLTAEIYDGWPGFIEGDAPGWIENTEGQIGFWQYTVVAELPTGDYDADLDVDEDDFAVWRSGFSGTVDLSADGSGNGIVDAADYVLWRKNLGKSAELPSAMRGAAVGVPEPTISNLAFVAAFRLLLVRRRCRLATYGVRQTGNLDE